MGRRLLWLIGALLVAGVGMGQVIVTPPPAPPQVPFNPSPADKATGIATSQVLSWSAPLGAVTYDVRFSANCTLDPLPILSAGQVGTTASPALTLSTTYCWQITARNPSGLNQGPIWRFTTAGGGSGLIQQGNLIYQGAFRVSGTNGSSYGAGVGLTYDPAGNGGAGSLFMFGGQATEIAIPVPSLSPILSNLPTAVVLQDYGSPVDGVNILPANTPGGLLIAGGKLLSTFYVGYDGASYPGSQFNTPWRHNKTLTNNGSLEGPFTGNFGTFDGGTPFSAGMFTGALGTIPPNWQIALGGTAFGSLWNISIITRTSAGPSLVAFDPARLGIDNPFTARVLLGYPNGHQNELWDQLNGRVYNAPNYFSWGDNFSESQVTAAVIPDGFNSALFFFEHGTGPFVYGDASIAFPFDSALGGSNPPISQGGTSDGTNASTNSTGTIVTCPGKTFGQFGDWIWMPGSTAPVWPDGSHRGVSEIVSNNGGGQYTVRDAMTANLANQSYRLASLADSPPADLIGYDPMHQGKGVHAWPYETRVKAYDLNDLAAVNAGTKTPWSLRPYATWTLALTFAQGAAPASGTLDSRRYNIPGAAWDATNHILYLAQYGADPGSGFANLPIINVFKVQ